MGNRDKSFLKIGLLVLIAAFSIFGLTVMCLLFGYLNQSSDTPESEKLGFFNYLLPFLLTLAFIVYFVFSQISTEAIEGIKKQWLVLTLLVIAAVIAVPWQIKHISWLVGKVETHHKVDAFEWVPILAGLIATIGSIVEEAYKIIKEKNITQQGS